MAKASIQQAVDAAIKLQQAGRLQEAEQLCKQVLAEQADHPAALHVMAVVMHQTGRNAEALPLIQRAVAKKTTDAEFRNSMGVMLMAAGRSQEALLSFQSAIKLHPAFPGALTNLANLLLDSGRWEEAANAARKAIQLAPRLTEAYSLLGAACFVGGKIDESIQASQKALSMDPKSYQALGNLGNSMMVSGRIDEAIQIYRRTTQLHPNSAGGWSNLGNALQQRAMTNDALQALTKATQLDPNLADAHNNLGNVYKDLAQMDIACEEYVKAIAIRPQMSTFHSNLVYAMWFCQGCEALEVYKESKKWADFLAEPLRKASAQHANVRDPNKRIKIGYVSSDFRDHPVGRLIRPLIENHDRTRFEVVLFSGVSRYDHLSQRIYSHADKVLNTRDDSDETLANRIRAEGIDICIDLTLHMGGSRMPAFARKPAPVQITYLAYCATSGMKSMDYCVSDANLDPAPPGVNEQDTLSPFHSERILRLNGCYWCYSVSPEAPPVNQLPALAKGYPTFGSFNSFTKLNEVVIDVWARILREIPNARLFMVVPGGPSMQQTAAGKFAQRGVDPSRLTMSDITPFAIYFQHFLHVDVALDPYPYNGGTTTMDALFMGLPVVNLEGRWATARAGVTLLKNVGHPEWIGKSVDEYVQIAKDLVADLPALNQRRQQLRQVMINSPLMNGKNFALDMEAAYRRAWARYCAGDESPGRPEEWMGY
jgi:predicted O-linked N-acetylglucosamine transferase (SPINDLY family)